MLDLFSFVMLDDCLRRRRAYTPRSSHHIRQEKPRYHHSHHHDIRLGYAMTILPAAAEPPR